MNFNLRLHHEIWNEACIFAMQFSAAIFADCWNLSQG